MRSSIGVPAGWRDRGIARRIATALHLAILLPWPSVAGAQSEDFAPESREWNGLSSLVEVAAEEDIPITIVERLDVGTLEPDVALLIVGPRHEPSIEGLSELLRSGARIAVADDFGASEPLLRAFHIDRHEPLPHRASALRGNEALLIARPNGAHALSARVEALVTNHPQAIAHEELEPIFAFGERDALVLAGAVGTGRLVVISDPSVLINNMLELGGNRRFSANLLRYLTEGGAAAGDDGASASSRAVRPLYLVPPDAAIVGRFGEPGADRPLHDLRAFLERLGEVEVPAAGLKVLALCLVAIFALIAGSILPRKSPYGAKNMFSPAVTFGGMAGRMAWYGQGNVDLVDPLLAYKFELENELYRRLALSRPVATAQVQAALRARGMPAREVTTAAALLDELSEVAERADRGTVEAVPLARLRDAMRRGDALLTTVRRLAPAGSVTVEPKSGARA